MQGGIKRAIKGALLCFFVLVKVWTNGNLSPLTSKVHQPFVILGDFLCQELDPTKNVNLWIGLRESLQDIMMFSMFFL